MLDMRFCKNWATSFPEAVVPGLVWMLKLLWSGIWFFLSDLVKIVKLAPVIPISQPTSFLQSMLRSYMNCTDTITSDEICQLCFKKWCTVQFLQSTRKAAPYDFVMSSYSPRISFVLSCCWPCGGILVSNWFLFFASK